MKKEKLSDCLGEIDDRFIEEADGYKKKNTHAWVKWASCAACICVVAVTAFLCLPGKTRQKQPPLTYSESGYSLYIPAVELPENTDGMSSDMIGLVVYKGGIYTQSDSYYNEDAEAVEKLVGEHLGHAMGNIDEWSTQDEYAKDFASTVGGDVYSVNGYDTSFRLCIYNEYIDEQGEKVKNIEFYERLNGIGLNTGADLFQTRLKVPGNWKKAKYQTHVNWDNYGRPYYEYSELKGVSNDDIDAFINRLCEGRFEYVYDRYSEFYNPEYYGDGTVRKQGHLLLDMQDNTVVELHLFEGGYVGYKYLGWYFVKMPGEAFEKVFNACIES